MHTAVCQLWSAKSAARSADAGTRATGIEHLLRAAFGGPTAAIQHSAQSALEDLGAQVLIDAGHCMPRGAACKQRLSRV
jgi:hypothetical protein